MTKCIARKFSYGWGKIPPRIRISDRIERKRESVPSGNSKENDDATPVAKLQKPAFGHLPIYMSRHFRIMIAAYDGLAFYAAQNTRSKGRVGSARLFTFGLWLSL